MTGASEFRSGKGDKDENFPVASRLISPRHRAPILAFYDFVRAADDIADHTALTADEKLRLLDGMDAALTGRGPDDPVATALRRQLDGRGLSPKHAQDLLGAFRQDARRGRYADWADLVAYCSLSAMPVGRFVLDVHGEDRRTWVASDPLCAALQVINHLQDCGDDARELDRVYLPADMLAQHDARIEDLHQSRATPALLAVVRDLADKSAGLLRESAVFPVLIADRRLAFEVAVIQSLAEALVTKLSRLDPLSERVHASKPEAAFAAATGVLKAMWARRRRPGAVVARPT